MQVSLIQPPLPQVIISPPSPHATEPSLHPQAPAAYPSSPPTSPLPFQTSHVPHPSTSPVPSDVLMNRQIRRQMSTPATSSAVRQAPHSHPTTALRSTALRVLPTEQWTCLLLWVSQTNRQNQYAPHSPPSQNRHQVIQIQYLESPILPLSLWHSRATSADCETCRKDMRAAIKSCR